MSEFRFDDVPGGGSDPTVSAMGFGAAGEGNSFPISMPDGHNGGFPTSSADGEGQGSVRADGGAGIMPTGSIDNDGGNIGPGSPASIVSEEALKPLERCTPDGDPPPDRLTIDVDAVLDRPLPADLETPTVGHPLDNPIPMEEIDAQREALERWLDVATGDSIGAILQGLGVPTEVAAAMGGIAEGFAGMASGGTPDP